MWLWDQPLKTPKIALRLTLAPVKAKMGTHQIDAQKLYHAVVNSMAVKGKIGNDGICTFHFVWTQECLRN